MQHPPSGSTESPTDDNDAAGATASVDIEELHENACQRGEKGYMDPATGLFVMTREALRQVRTSHRALVKRKRCCGNACRHCPYGHMTVQARSKRQNAITSSVLLQFSSVKKLDNKVRGGFEV
eukprot:scaffold7580_cov325-Pinguiococcus_pyrenoidosus.AAC.5